MIKPKHVALSLGALLFIVIFLPILQMQIPAYPGYGKGGMGLISDCIFVNTNMKTNEVTGCEDHQTLFFGDDHTPQFKLLTIKNRNLPLFIFFTRNRIYFYNFPGLNGGNYLRK